MGKFLNFLQEQAAIPEILDPLKGICQKHGYTVEWMGTYIEIKGKDQIASLNQNSWEFKNKSFQADLQKTIKNSGWDYDVSNDGKSLVLKLSNK